MDLQIWAEVRHTDRKLLGRRRGADITGTALHQIRAHLRPVLQFGRRWIDLQRVRPGQSRDFGNMQAEQLRNLLLGEYDEIVRELDSFKGRTPSIMIRGSLSYCQRALQNLRDLLDPEGWPQTGEPEPRQVLNADLLRIPRLPLNDEWEPEDFLDERLVRSILGMLQEDRRDWSRAFSGRCEAKDHEATERIIEYLMRQPNETSEVEESGSNAKSTYGNAETPLEGMSKTL